MKYNFVVKSSTQSSNGGFINKIETTTEKQVLGVKKLTKHAFLLKTEDQVEVGSVHELDLADYNQVTRATEVASNEDPDKMIVLTSIWLHEKIA
jgi:hypothetical protein